jgi:uncharacterized protein (TIGR02117 family)
MPLSSVIAHGRRLVPVVWLAAPMLAGCAEPPPPAGPTAGPKTVTVFLIERGWHTDVGVPAAQIGDSLDQLRTIFPGVQTLLIGFGERAYLQHRHHNFADMLAALIPGPGALLVTALRDAPQMAFPADDVIELRVSARGLARLTDFIAASFTGTTGVPSTGDALHPIADGPYPGSLFYASTRTYSAGYTCNTWTAEALQIAGLPIHAAGVLFADDVADQARQVAARPR